MNRIALIFVLTALPSAGLSQQSAQPLPTAPQAAILPAETLPGLQTQTSAGNTLFADSTPITRAQAEDQALKNNPRITAAKLLALASGQVTRRVRSNELPQVDAAATAVKAEDGSRLGAGSLTDSRVYTHFGAGGTLSQLLTDFGHTPNLVANARLLERAEQQNTLATAQDVLLATDEAFYRLLNAQSLLQVANATLQARGSTQNLTQALTKNGLKSDLDLNIAAADYSQAQLFQLDARNDVASASAALAALLAAPPTTQYHALEDLAAAPEAPPANSAPLIAEAQSQRPDLRALQFNQEAEHKLALANEEQRLPSISALATGGVTPIRPDGDFPQNWWGAAGVNVNIPIFTGFRISAETEEARLRERAIAQQKQALSDTIARDVQVAALASQTAFQRIGVAEKFRDEAAQALKLAQTRYQLGLSSIVELSQAQLQSTQADVSAVNARYDYLMSLRSLDYARGNLAP